VDNDEGLLSARVACPVRLSSRQVVGVIVLTVEADDLRAEHVLDVCKVAKKICKPLDTSERTEKQRRKLGRSAIQPFEEAELHLARVMSMPQLDPSTRATLAALLAELESGRRDLLLRGESVKSRRTGKAQARGVS
jgi:hypothetical protein